MADRWTSGDAYEPYVGRWSRLVAREFLRQLDVAPGSRWLDVGCGTGALTQAILAAAEPAEVVGVDPAEAFVEHAASHTADPRARFVVGSATELPAEAADRDAAVSGLVLNFVPDPDAAVAAMRGATRSGGTVAAYVWDYAGEMQMMRRFWDAAVALDPDAAAVEEGLRFPLCRPGPLAAVFEGAGLADVEAAAIDVETRFADFDDYWTPFLGGQGPAPGYLMSLPEDRRAALREHLRVTLPTAADGSIPLVARAWAVRGRRP